MLNSFQIIHKLHMKIVQATIISVPEFPNISPRKSADKFQKLIIRVSFIVKSDKIRRILPKHSSFGFIFFMFQSSLFQKIHQLYYFGRAFFFLMEIAFTVFPDFQSVSVQTEKIDCDILDTFMIHASVFVGMFFIKFCFNVLLDVQKKTEILYLI